MQLIRWTVLSIVLLLGIPLIVSAQPDTQTFDLQGGYTIEIPAGWESQPQPSSVAVFVNPNEPWSVVVLPPAELEAVGMDLTGFTDPRDVVVALGAGASTREDVSPQEYGGRPAARFQTPFDGQENLQIAIQLTDGSYGIVIFNGPADSLAAAEDVIEQIVASFDVAGAAPEATPAISEPGATCTVRARSADSSRLRVGPGENRSAIAFLPANTEVMVTGRIELDNGSTWFQLDKDEAAPQGTAAAELWVNAEDVSTTGDCDRVGEASAPPIVPIVSAAPTIDPSQPAAASGEMPVAGTWTITLAPTMALSCVGAETDIQNTSASNVPATFGGPLSPVDGGSFTFVGGLFRREGNSNSFTGVVEDSSISSQVRFDLISATRMSGQIVTTPKDGSPCTLVVDFTARPR